MISANIDRSFKRYEITARLSKLDRNALIEEYCEFYREIAKVDPDLLNQKLPRDVFSDILRELGGYLQEKARALATEAGPVLEFMDQNNLPPSLSQHLTPEFRAFCLLLNALKQWVAAEQLATDRVLLGGNGRSELRRIAGSCVATGSNLDEGCELHHPVRDGRPPIPLCKVVHDKIEGQQAHVGAASDEHLEKIQSVRGRNSWVNLRRGCLDLMNEPVEHSTPAVRAGSRHFAKQAAFISGLGYGEIIGWMDSTGRGVLDD